MVLTPPYLKVQELTELTYKASFISFTSLVYMVRWKKL